MKCSMTDQEKGDLLIQVTTWAGSTVYEFSKLSKSSFDFYNELVKTNS